MAMALSIGNVRNGRAGLVTSSGGSTDLTDLATQNRPQEKQSALRNAFWWGVHGYQKTNAGDLSAAVAFNAMVALIPTFLLLLAVTGAFLQTDQALTTAIYSSLWGLPPAASQDALNAALTARRSTGWIAALSLIGFAWAGTNFVGCLARSMNRIYGVPGCGFMCEKRRGFFVILGFAVLFTLALVTSTIPTLFVNQELPAYFRTWTLAAGRYQVVGYGVGFIATSALFGMLYRVVPNAGQRIRDIWPGTITASLLFVVMAQVFPVYLRLIGGANRYGATFGLITLLVAWFFLLSHVILFGTYVNVTHQRHRRAKANLDPITAQAVNDQSAP
jgi:membrane protein